MHVSTVLVLNQAAVLMTRYQIVRLPANNLNQL